MSESAVGPVVVVGLDGSAHSQRALDWAMNYAGSMGGRVHAVLAWEIPIGPWSATGAAVDVLFTGEYDFGAAARAQLDRIMAAWVGPNSSVPVDSEAREGNASAVILAVADEQHADLIVLGSRGLGSFKGLMMGSVSQRCAAHAKCPVVITR